MQSRKKELKQDQRLRKLEIVFSNKLAKENKGRIQWRKNGKRFRSIENEAPDVQMKRNISNEMTFDGLGQ